MKSSGFGWCVGCVGGVGLKHIGLFSLFGVCVMFGMICYQEWIMFSGLGLMGGIAT